MNQNFNTPILFLIFNRPDVTQKVFDVIRQVKPKKLFISADGPRINKVGEKEKCEETRNIIKQIDWDCEVKTLFRNENLGCGKAVSGAITWFFENVEEGIILEDDCLPNISFFKYCEYLLDKYRNDERIFMVSGDNFLPEKIQPKESYYFTNYPHIWGWASWRRAWSKYDIEMKDLSNFVNQNKITNFIGNKYVQNYFIERFNEVKLGLIDTWDYQWTYTIWNNNGCSIAPNCNLISNIGFGVDSTHTHNKDDKTSNLKTVELSFPLLDNKYCIYEKGDNYQFKSLVNKKYFLKNILKKIRLFNFIKKIYIKL